MLKPDTHEELHPNEPIEIKNQRRSETANRVQQFLAQGGTIKQVDRGVSGEKRKKSMARLVYGDAPERFK